MFHQKQELDAIAMPLEHKENLYAFQRGSLKPEWIFYLHPLFIFPDTLDIATRQEPPSARRERTEINPWRFDIFTLFSHQERVSAKESATGLDGQYKKK